MKITQTIIIIIKFFIDVSLRINHSTYHSITEYICKLSNYVFRVDSSILN